jgi:hypothetical protein
MRCGTALCGSNKKTSGHWWCPWWATFRVMGDAKHPSGGTGRYDTLSAESSSDSDSEVTVSGPEAALEPLPREGLDGAGPQKGAESAGSAGSTCAEGSSSRPAVSINAAFTFAPVVNVHSGSNVNISFNISAGANAPSVQFSPLVGTGPSGEVSLPRGGRSSWCARGCLGAANPGAGRASPTAAAENGVSGDGCGQQGACTPNAPHPPPTLVQTLACNHLYTQLLVFAACAVA